MATQQSNARAAKIRMIQVARRQLGLDDDTYRAAIALAVPGKTSSADCTVGQLDRIIDHLKKKGFKPKKPAGAPPRPERRTLDTSAEASKARAVWLLLAEIGAVRDPSEAALNAYVRRQAGVDDLAWVRDMEPVIEGLKAWAVRTLPAAIRSRLDALTAAGLPVPWRSLESAAAQVAPGRRADTFGALQAIWSALRAHPVDRVAL